MGRTTLFQVDASSARGLSRAIAWGFRVRPIGWQHSGVPTAVHLNNAASISSFGR